MKAALIVIQRWRIVGLGLATGLLCASMGFGQETGQGDFPGTVRLVLPPTIYAVPDVEMNIYFDNIVLVANPTNYIFDVTSEKGFQYDRRWSFTPEADDCGDHSIVIQVLNETNRIVVQARSTIHVTCNRNETTKRVSLLAIGDSHLQRDHCLQHVLEISKQQKGLQLTLVGSRDRSKFWISQ